jgi:phosphate transport system permease protein
MKTTGKRGKQTAGLREFNVAARGEPAIWTMGGTLVLGVLMIVAFLILVIWNGVITFYPGIVQVVTLKDGRIVTGERHRYETYRPSAAQLVDVEPSIRQAIAAKGGIAKRVLYKTGNYDLYNEDYRWVDEFAIADNLEPQDVFYFERLEWGPFIGFIRSAEFDDRVITPEAGWLTLIQQEHHKAVERRHQIRRIDRKQIGRINHRLEKARLDLRKVELSEGTDSSAYLEAVHQHDNLVAALKQEYRELEKTVDAIKLENQRYKLNLETGDGRTKTVILSDIVRFYEPNRLSFLQRLGVYFSRWAEFLTAEPREANTEGGVMPAIFGTFCMTILLALAVAPFGVMAALYLREYARQGKLVSIVRICVNNLAGVPSIVYGVFGLGFFAYTIGGSIDALFYPERLPSPTFGTGGLLWASLTLALLTVPVVIVATEEALAAVPKSLREGSLACGASKWQTVKNIVLPKAMPGILTGLILAMARGAGEVAPLMLVGVVKMAPELPLDGIFPYLHLERSFMHLGFQIFDVGFQSRNAEAGKPMVFVTTLLLITLVAVMNATAISIRNRLTRKYATGHF